MPLDLETRIKGDRLHGSAVAFASRGVLIVGGSGSGKSGLALQLMALGGTLISDDQVILGFDDAGITLSAPPSIVGKIEARGIGLICAPKATTAPLHLVVDMDRPAPARLPKPDHARLNQMTFDLIYGRDTPNLGAVVMLLLAGANRTD